MYGNTKDNILNTTLFFQNASDVAYICIDSVENLYVYFIYKFQQFGNDFTNVGLGFIQNLLGKVITINKIFN
jgi:hypothetical protein